MVVLVVAFACAHGGMFAVVLDATPPDDEREESNALGAIILVDGALSFLTSELLRNLLWRQVFNLPDSWAGYKLAPTDCGLAALGFSIAEWLVQGV